MGIDYTTSIAVGFDVSDDDLYETFGVHYPEQSHMEDRWDPKTGKKLAPVKVIDRAEGRVLEFEGTEHQDALSLATAICEKIGCAMNYSKNFYGGDETERYVFGPILKHHEFGDYRGGERFSLVAARIRLRDVIEAEGELARIKRELEALGLEPGEPWIAGTYDIS